MNNKIILGTVQFGLDYGINNSSGKMSEEEVFKILDLAYSSNLTVLDTAAAYGNSEERIGDYLYSNRDKNFRIITKFNLKQNLTPIHSLEKSLQNLKIDQVNAVMFHSFEDFKSTKEEEINSLLELKGKKYMKLGISLYTNAQMKEIAEKEIFDLVQVPFNVLDNEKQRGEILKELKRKNLEIHTRSVFLQGLFFMKKDRIPVKLHPLVKYLNDLESIAEHFSLDISTLATQYALSKEYIDCVLIGVDSVDQLKINLKNIESKVPLPALNAIDEIFVTETSLLNPSTWNL